MRSSARRPLGLTLIVALIVIQGVIALGVGLDLTGVIDVLPQPLVGSTGATGAAMVIVGVASILVAVALFSLRFWAYVLVLLVLGLTMFAGIFALIQHGVNAENAPSLVPMLITAVVLGYLLSDNVRPFFDR